jgi:hypothetical protein
MQRTTSNLGLPSLLTALSLALGCGAESDLVDDGEHASTPELASKEQAISTQSCDAEQIAEIQSLHDTAVSDFLHGMDAYIADPFHPQAVRSFGQPDYNRYQFVRSAMSLTAATFAGNVTYDCSGWSAACQSSDAEAPSWGLVKLCPSFWRIEEDGTKLFVLQHEYMHWALGGGHVTEDFYHSLAYAHSAPDAVIKNPTNYAIYALNM